jgi:hypothetical protein
MTPMPRIAPILLAALALCACANTGPSRYQAEVDRLEAECKARDGILMPIPGAVSGNAGANYTCNIVGGPARP